MNVPSWIQDILDRFNAKTEPHSELEIADTLSKERSKHGDLSEEDWKGYIAEYSVFFFGEGGDGESIWGTYFRPMVEFTQGQNTVRNPDITQLEQFKNYCSRASTGRAALQRRVPADPSPPSRLQPAAPRLHK